MTHYDLPDKLNARGCFQLLTAVLCSSVYQLDKYKIVGKKGFKRLVYDKEGTEILRRTNIRFADSKAVQMWCDCAGYDFEKIRDGIIRVNKKNFKL